VHTTPETFPFLTLSTASTKVSNPGALASTLSYANRFLRFSFSFFKLSILSSKHWVSFLPDEEGSFSQALSLSLYLSASLFFLDMDGDSWCPLTLILYFGHLSPIFLSTGLFPTLTFKGWGYSLVSAGASSDILVCFQRVVLAFFLMNSSQLLPW